MNNPRPHTHRDPGQLRRQIHEALDRARSFRELSPEDRERVRDNLTNVLSFVDDSVRSVAGKRLARGLAEGDKPQPWGNATQSTGAAMAGLVDAVAFPDFVSSLIDGVFASIVDSSIRQMHEFAKFLEAIVKSVDQFAREHVTLEDARTNVQERFPGQLAVNDGRLSPTDTASDGLMGELGKMFGLGAEPDLSDEESEAQLVRAAQMELAKQRQQMLATMVLMGINRIVVTEGQIKASVKIDVKGKDTSSSSQDFSATHSDEYKKDTERSSSGWGSSSKQKTTFTSVNTSSLNTSGKSQSEIEANAKLAGEVLVKFKSETFPLERLASPAELSAVNDRSKK